MKTSHLDNIFLYLIRIYGTNYRKRLYSHGKRISLSCETPDNVFPLVQANLKFASREYKNLQFEKRKTIQRRMLKI